MIGAMESEGLLEMQSRPKLITSGAFLGFSAALDRWG